MANNRSLHSWFARFHNEMAPISAKFAKLITQIKDLEGKIKKLDRGRVALVELEAIQRELKGLSNMADIHPESIGQLTELLKTLVEIEQIFDWHKVQQENVELFHKMQEEDLLRIQKEMVEILQTQKKLIEELGKELKELEMRLKAELELMDHQLREVEATITVVIGKIAGLKQQLTDLNQQVEAVPTNFALHTSHHFHTKYQLLLSHHDLVADFHECVLARSGNGQHLHEVDHNQLVFGLKHKVSERLRAVAKEKNLVVDHSQLEQEVHQLAHQFVGGMVGLMGEIGGISLELDQLNTDLKNLLEKKEGLVERIKEREETLSLVQQQVGMVDRGAVFQLVQAEPKVEVVLGEGGPKLS